MSHFKLTFSFYMMNSNNLISIDYKDVLIKMDFKNMAYLYCIHTSDNFVILWCVYIYSKIYSTHLFHIKWPMQRITHVKVTFLHENK